MTLRRLSVAMCMNTLAMQNVCVLQLETIYVLEGLGPPKEHPPGSKSFKDQVQRAQSMPSIVARKKRKVYAVGCHDGSLSIQKQPEKAL